MRRFAGAVLAGTCLVGSAACNGHSGATERTRPAPNLPEVEFPAPTLDPGVMKVGAAAKASTGSPVGPLDPSGLRLQLDRCVLRGPGERVVNGRVVLPKGAHDVAATLELALGYGIGTGVDERSWRHRVTFSGSGSFAVVMTAIPIGSYEQVPGLVDPRTPYDDTGRGCVATVLSASVPVATQRVQVKASITRDPFVYSAPADSIQALGISAPLRDKQDARTISLYTVWADRRTAIPKAWVPVVAGRRPALLSIVPAHRWCTQIRIGIGNFGDVREFPESPDWITVTTRLNCGEPVDGTLFDTHEPVEGATGFTWAQTFNDARDVARRTIGPYEVWVTGGSAITRERVAHVAATLTTRRNLAITGRPVPARPATVDAALTRLLTTDGSLRNNHERARFLYRGGWMIFLETAKPAEWDAAQIQAGHISSGWWTLTLQQGLPPSQRCFARETVQRSTPGDLGPQPVDGGRPYSYAITGDPRWKIEGFADGQWRTLATTNGMLFDDGTAPFPERLRPIDTAGHVPACFLAENPSG